MDMGAVAVMVVVALLYFLLSGLWIGMAMLATATVVFLVGTNAPVGTIMATAIWGGSSSWTLTALPLFVWMGEILFRSKLSEQMFTGLVPWLNRLPGRLLHVNVVASGIFAAACGSSAATLATIGRISLPELAKRGYDDRMSLGPLAGAATLGIMIPPSITFIVYGVSAEVSIARLFAAGVLPGIMLILLFMGYIVVWALLNPTKIPAREPGTSLADKFRRGKYLIPIVLLIAAVIGSIYAGVATATESAVIGVVGALGLSAASGGLTWSLFIDSVREATRTSCMIAFIIMGSLFLTAAVDFTGLPVWIAKYIGSFGLSAYGLLAVLAVLFVMLGCFLDGISIVVLASSLLLPSVQAAGIDVIWFGVFMVLMVEMSMVTPPVGLNLFVMQLMSGRSLGYISYATLPFFILMLVGTLMLVLFPQIATFLPSRLF